MLTPPSALSRCPQDEAQPGDSAKVAHVCSWNGLTFCSTKLTQDEYDDAENGVDVEAAIPEGMSEPSRQFEALGGERTHASRPNEA